MSLPSYAYIYSADGTLVDEQFVNCGWWVDAPALARVLMFDVEDNGYADTHSIVLYGITVPVKLLRSVKDVRELEGHLEGLIEEYNSRQRTDGVK